MKNRWKFTLKAIGAIALIGVVVSSQITTVWDGGFRRAEYRLRLLNQDGIPLDGLQMDVLNGVGKPAEHYPVAEYFSAKPVLQNSEGEFVFHQTRDGIQFGGSYWKLFGLVTIGNRKAPSYVLRFSKDGRDYEELPFGALDRDIDFNTTPKVHRAIKACDLVTPAVAKNLTEEELNEVGEEIEFLLVERTFVIQ